MILLFLASLSAALAGPIRIMPLGDSITQGYIYGVLPEWRVGYRQKLYLDLSYTGYDVDFVGSQSAGSQAIPVFDVNHEGHPGWCADGCGGQDILDYMATFLNNNPPDVVLLHVGTNDIDANVQDPNSVKGILDEIYAHDPNITVVLARIISRTDGKASQTRLFNDAVEAMAKARPEYGDRLRLVDMESALTYPDDLYSDGVHPTPSGYAKMADVWLSALYDVLNPSPVQNMTAGNSVLYADFGPEGIRKYGSPWAQISFSDPEDMVAAGTTLYGDFGPGGPGYGGIWRYASGAWKQITENNPEAMTAAGSYLYANFGAGGIWRYDGTTWIQIR